MILYTLIIILAVLLVLALVTPLFSPFFRARKLLTPAMEEEGDDTTEPISIVIVEHDSAERLEQILPRYLSQDYAGDFQVIVVIDKDDSESEDVLKRAGDDPRLYYTFLPAASRYLSRKKLGITLGMRAAKYDWVVVTDVHCAPASDQWLTNFARHCTTEKTLVLGMTPYECDAPRYYRFEHLRTMLYHLRQAQKGIAFSTNQSMVAIRKSEFFRQKGFSGNLEYTRAEFDFLVNKFAEEGNTAIAIEEDSWLQQFNPKPERWRGRQLFTIDAMKGLQRKGWFKFLMYLDNNLIHLFNVLTVLAVAFGGILILNLRLCSTQGLEVSFIEELTYIGFIAAVMIIWLISIIERYIIYHKPLKYFTTINPLVAIILEWTMSLRNIILAIRYRFSDKTDFITHKL